VLVNQISFKKISIAKKRFEAKLKTPTWPASRLRRL